MHLTKMKHDNLHIFLLGKGQFVSIWIFSVKQNQVGFVKRYKAQLVAQRYAQTQGIDYHETFSSVAKMDSIWVLISCVARLGWDRR